MHDAKISYAQNREDIILEALVLKAATGFYVDVGAGDPDKDSVTKRFYLKGWSGINIEPDVLLCERLALDRPRDANLCVEAGDHAGTRRYGNRSIEVRTLSSIFEEHQVSVIDFLKIDVGGAEWGVVQGNNWDVYRPRVLCIEANSTTRLQKWHDLFDNVQYEFVFFDGLNEYYRDARLEPRLRFSYADAILALPVVTYEDYTRQSELITNIGKLNQELNLARIHIRHLWKLTDAKQRYSNELEEEIRQMRRVRYALKTFIKAVNNAIEHRIESINRPAVLVVAPGSKPVLSLDSADTAGVLLKRLQVFDLEANYSRHIRNLAPNRATYSVIKGAYVYLKRSCKLCIKGARRILGVIKK